MLLGRVKTEQPIDERIMAPIRERHRKRWLERRALWRIVKAHSLWLLSRPV